MNKHRKFNSETFFRGFEGHESELHGLFAAYGVNAPEDGDVAALYSVLIGATSDEVQNLLACLHELNDLSSGEGREILDQTCIQMGVDPPSEDVCNPRAACSVFSHHRPVFDHAMELLAVRSIQSHNVAVFPGRDAYPISDGDATAVEMAALLRTPLRQIKNTDALEVRHYFDGDMFVVVVFCERNAEVHLEFGSSTSRVVSRVRRPADQHVLLYHQSTGHLEIEGARVRERAILREAFSVAAFGDEEFFPANEDSELLALGSLIEHNFTLATRPGHTARVTALRLSGAHGGRKASFDFRSGRNDLIDVLHARRMLEGATPGMEVHSVRIELVLEQNRNGRKSIILTGPNSIQFNRASHADAVYRYLQDWGLIRDGVAVASLI